MFNKTVAVSALTVLVFAFAACPTASADFSYNRTQKVSGGSMAAMAGTAANAGGKTYFKGQKSAMVAGDVTTVIDFGAQTVTTINATAKTYKVQKFSDISAAGANVAADVTAVVKETGQKKMVNGFNASETLVTMDMSLEMGRGASMQMQAEISIWIAPDVPGSKEMHDFFQKNASNFPWAAMMSGAGGNQSIQKAIGQLMKKLASMGGTPVEEVIRVKPAGGAGAPQVAMPQMPQMNSAQQAQMGAAMAKLQEMAKQPGPAGVAAQQQLAKMGSMPGMGGAAPAAGGASSSLIELTVDNTEFSSDSVADSAFAIPAGFKQIP